MAVSDAEIARPCKRRKLPEITATEIELARKGSVGQGPGESGSSTSRAADTVASSGLRFCISSASSGEADRTASTTPVGMMVASALIPGVTTTLGFTHKDAFSLRCKHEVDLRFHRPSDVDQLFRAAPLALCSEWLRVLSRSTKAEAPVGERPSHPGSAAKCGRNAADNVYGFPRHGNRWKATNPESLRTATMTLSQAIGMSDQTAPLLALQINGSHVEPRCHVCRSDGVRQRVNDLLASGASYASTLRALGGDAVGVTTDSIRRHAERHFPVQNAARATYREILERRAKENSIDFVNGVATAVTPMALLETIMVKGYEKLVDPDTEVDVKTGMAAACRLQEMIDSHTDQVDWARTNADIGRIIEVVRAFIPSERWPELQAALRRDEVLDALAERDSDEIEMVEIDDAFDEDVY
jgi:hypothetical protein